MRWAQRIFGSRCGPSRKAALIRIVEGLLTCNQQLVIEFGHMHDFEFQVIRA